MNMEQDGVIAEEAACAQPQPPQEPVPEVCTPCQMPEQAPIQPEELLKRTQKPGHKPPIGVRVVLQIISFLLCLLLTVSVLAATLLIDMNRLTSSGGIKQIITGVFSSARPRLPSVLLGANGAASASGGDSGYTIGVDENGNTVIIDSEGNATIVDGNEGTLEGGFSYSVDENGNVTISGGDGSESGGLDMDDISGIIGEGGNVDIGDIPTDIITNQDSNALIDWIYNMVDEATEEELPFTQEQLHEFVEESTVMDYVSEKLAGFAEDILNGTENTQITTEELTKLLEENEQLIEEKLDVEVTPEIREELEKVAEEIVVQGDINNTIRETVNTALEEATVGVGGVSLTEILEIVRMVTADPVMYAGIGVCVLLILLLLAANYYNLPAALTWAAVPCILMGLILSAPVAAIQFAPAALTAALPDLGSYISLVRGFVGALAPVHYGLLSLGFAMLLASIAWRIIRSIVRRNRRLAASV